MSTSARPKITVVGAGNVGASVAQYTVAINIFALESKYSYFHN